jgi:hypothetical protein
VASILLYQLTNVLGLDADFSEMIGFGGCSRGVLQVRSSRDSHQDWKKGEES